MPIAGLTSFPDASVIAASMLRNREARAAAAADAPTPNDAPAGPANDPDLPSSQPSSSSDSDTTPQPDSDSNGSATESTSAEHDGPDVANDESTDTAAENVGSDRIEELLEDLDAGDSEADQDVDTGTPHDPDDSDQQRTDAGVDDTPTTGDPDNTGDDALAAPDVRIYDASTLGSGGALQALGSAREIGSDDPASAQWAAIHAQQALEYFAANGRDGVRDDGTPLDVRVEDTTTDEDGTEIHLGNAGYYTAYPADGGEIEFLRYGRGARRPLADGRVSLTQSMATSYDLTVHELTHGILKAETGDVGGSADESGANHEALADLMAAAATHDWEIGEDAYRDESDIQVLRDIANPDRSDAFHGLYDNMDEYNAAAAANGEVEEHYASGIVSQAGYRMQEQMGWEAFEDLVWATIEGDNLGDLSFAATANALRGAAVNAFGPNSAEAAAVDRELAAAGL